MKKAVITTHSKNLTNYSYLSTSPSSHTSPLASTPPLIADTGCTSHFCTVDTPVINKRPTNNPLTIQNPNGSLMHSTHEADLDWPMLPPAARHVHIVPALGQFSLISMGQLCDAGCHVLFTSSTVQVFMNGTCILAGSRHPTTQLWHLKQESPPPLCCNMLPATIPATAHRALGSADPAALVAFAHAALFSPAIATLHIALTRNFLPALPGLTTTLLRKHPPRSSAMIKGHLDQSRKNQQSTKKQGPTLPTPPPICTMGYSGKISNDS